MWKVDCLSTRAKETKMQTPDQRWVRRRDVFIFIRGGTLKMWIPVRKLCRAADPPTPLFTRTWTNWVTLPVKFLAVDDEKAERTHDNSLIRVRTRAWTVFVGMPTDSFELLLRTSCYSVGPPSCSLSHLGAFEHFLTHYTKPSFARQI